MSAPESKTIMYNYDPNYIPKKSFALVGQKAIVLDSDKKILVIQRSEKSGGGKWSLPGGALEYKEEPYAAIQREINEETQLRVTSVKPFHLKSSLNKKREYVVIIGYVCKTNSKDVQLNWEHDDFNWLNKKEALKLDLTSDGKIFIERFGDLQNVVY